MLIPLQRQMQQAPKRWLITGVAGFIGSHLMQCLLQAQQIVIGIDNLSTGRLQNLKAVQALLAKDQWTNFTFIEGDIRSVADCQKAMQDIDYVLHHAALVSVDYSWDNPLLTHDTNVTGFLNILLAAKQSKVKRIIYASSSSVYGNQTSLPYTEAERENPLSPYALSKLINEQQAQWFSRQYGLPCIGLRYFNVYGPRQNPVGDYAAVIPRWIATLLQSDAPIIYGDGLNTRDFCYIEDIIQANLLAALNNDPAAMNQVYNIATNQPINLQQLLYEIQSALLGQNEHLIFKPAIYANAKPNDIRHSQGDYTKAQRLLNYYPHYTLQQGIKALLLTPPVAIT